VIMKAPRVKSVVRRQESGVRRQEKGATAVSPSFPPSFLRRQESIIEALLTVGKRESRA
jgi:hypothetical protein